MKSNFMNSLISQGVITSIMNFIVFKVFVLKNYKLYNHINWFQLSHILLYLYVEVELEGNKMRPN